jgi:hypothetical protein
VVRTRSAVHTWQGRAFVDVCFAVSSCVAGHAATDVAVYSVITRSAVQTRIRRALVDIRFAVGSREAEHAVAGVAVHEIVTRSAVETGVGHALVDVRLAVPPRVAGHAVACVAVLTIRARAAMLARVAGAFVYLGSAVFPRPAGSALAVEATWRTLRARGTFAARVLIATVDGCLAVGPGEPLGTLAEVLIVGVETGAVVQTRLALTLVNVGLAVESGEARKAGADVASNIILGTRAAVQTRQARTRARRERVGEAFAGR